MSKKILIVGQHFWPESFRINDIADYLVNEKGCEVDVLCGLPNYPSGKFPEGYGYFKNRRQNYKGANIHRAMEIPRGNNSNVRIFLNYISFPIASLFYIPYFLTKKYDKIFIYQLSPVMMSLAGIILGKLKRTETTMYVLDLWPDNLFSVLPIQNSLLRKIAYAVSAWHYKRANKLVALSEKMKSRLISVAGKSDEDIVVLPQACESIYETNIRDTALENRFKSGFNIVFTGNISPAQSFETVIKAAETLQKKGYEDLNWIIVGDGMSMQSVQKSVKTAGLKKYFHFEGMHPIEEVPKYTYVADVLIGCLVKSELLEATIPAKVMSYIASGKPIVLAMDGEVQPLINDTIACGFAGNAGDAVTLAQNIEKVYKLDKADRLKLGTNAKKYHKKYFAREIILNKLYSFIFS